MRIDCFFGGLSPTFFGRGGAVLGMKCMFNGPRGGYYSISIGWTGFNTSWGIGIGVGGSRYHIGIRNVKLGKLRVAITGLLMIPYGGNMKGIWWIRKEPQ